MANQDLAAALRRAETVLRRRPDMGLQSDATATARWTGGTRVVTRHANGKEVASDMAPELGGTGDCVSPGWLFRAGLGSCAATTIVMAAAAAGFALDTLEVEVNSQSDTRGLLGMTDADGAQVYAGPTGLELRIRVAARGKTAAEMRTFIEQAMERSPVPCALRGATPLALRVEVTEV